MDILNKIKSAIIKGNINITDHADTRIVEWDISDDELYDSVLNGQVIEEYTDDKPFPSCLIYGMSNNKYIHSVWAYSEEQDIAVVITVYIPDKNKWIDYKIRK
ncbi:MAG: hypothetical protein BWK75_00440 [Candidatus Altiarchaeales archaeon A3]|nr:MAG: hypothetical protein BWK75_00440 [Candidatus Altiarchaeales archaeon A3]